MGIFDSIVNNLKGIGKSEAGKAINQTVKNAGNAVASAVSNTTKKFTFNAIPAGIDEFKALKEADLKDPFGVVALTVLAFNTYVNDKQAGTAMLNYLKGPEPLSPSDDTFIRDRFMDGKSFVVRSYFKGAKPENDYTPEQPYTIEVQEQAHSRDTIKEGYIKLFITSGASPSDGAIVK